MPNKTIYVSDDDLPLFERAQQLADANLSSAIVQALRRFIEIEEARQRGFEEITVLVNGEGAHQRKRFLGYRLARWRLENAHRRLLCVVPICKDGNTVELHAWYE